MERDKQIKKLQEGIEKTDNEVIKAALKKRIDALKHNKPVQK